MRRRYLPHIQTRITQPPFDEHLDLPPQRHLTDAPAQPGTFLSHDIKGPE